MRRVFARQIGSNSVLPEVWTPGKRIVSDRARDGCVCERVKFTSRASWRRSGMPVFVSTLRKRTQRGSGSVHGTNFASRKSNDPFDNSIAGYRSQTDDRRLREIVAVIVSGCMRNDKHSPRRPTEPAVERYSVRRSASQPKRNLQNAETAPSTRVLARNAEETAPFGRQMVQKVETQTKNDSRFPWSHENSSCFRLPEGSKAKRTIVFVRAETSSVGPRTWRDVVHSRP